jgi:hypothetical protein
MLFSNLKRLRARALLLYFFIGVNTALMFINVLILSDLEAAGLNFITCLASWAGILVLDLLEARYRSGGSTGHVNNDESGKGNEDDR